ncbi:hypothetical protein B0H19DRAFT_1061181 [Mycena capillaripes]|nr:hypothetical protein B0H19DRAFT_1061181 [Mycena capillaripes]
MTAPAQIVTDASSPFDDPSGDIIIRSSENVDFRMHKVLLALASSFFKEMFEIPLGQTIDGEGKERPQPDEVRDGIPIIRMYDDRNRACGKDVVEFILSSCHPARFQSIAPLTAKMLRPVIDVATRYCMDWTVKTILHDPHLLKTNPFLVFAHAGHKGFVAEAALAAKETLRFCTQDFPHEPALKLISAYQYHALLESHKRCGRAAAAITGGENLIDWIPKETLLLFPEPHRSCTGPTHDRDAEVNRWNIPRPATPKIKLRLCFSTPSWWNEYMESTAAALKLKPHRSTINDPVRVGEALKKAVSCTACAGKAYPLMAAFIPLFEQKIEEVVRKVGVPRALFVSSMMLMHRLKIIEGSVFI